MYEENKNHSKPEDLQDIHIYSRREFEASGVRDVGDFNENQIILFTLRGKCTIKGSGLKMKSLNLEDGRVMLEGMIQSVAYAEKSNNESLNLLRRVFK